MRTTVDIDDAIMAELRQRAHRRHTSLKTVVNEALRTAVAGGDVAGAEPYTCPTFAMGECRHAGFDMDKALRIAGAVEDAEIARKLELRK